MRADLDFLRCCNSCGKSQSNSSLSVYRLSANVTVCRAKVHQGTWKRTLDSARFILGRRLLFNDLALVNAGFALVERRGFFKLPDCRLSFPVRKREAALKPRFRDGLLLLWDASAASRSLSPFIFGPEAEPVLVPPPGLKPSGFCCLSSCSSTEL